MLMIEAGFHGVTVERDTKVLNVPPATDSQRTVLQRDVVAGWQAFEEGYGLRRRRQSSLIVGHAARSRHQDGWRTTATLTLNCC